MNALIVSMLRLGVFDRLKNMPKHYGNLLLRTVKMHLQLEMGFQRTLMLGTQKMEKRSARTLASMKQETEISNMCHKKNRADAK